MKKQKTAKKLFYAIMRYLSMGLSRFFVKMKINLSMKFKNLMCKLINDERNHLVFVGRPPNDFHNLFKVQDQYSSKIDFNVFKCDKN